MFVKTLTVESNWKIADEKMKMSLSQNYGRGLPVGYFEGDVAVGVGYNVNFEITEKLPCGTNCSPVLPPECAEVEVIQGDDGVYSCKWSLESPLFFRNKSDAKLVVKTIEQILCDYQACYVIASGIPLRDAVQATQVFAIHNHQSQKVGVNFADIATWNDEYNALKLEPLVTEDGKIVLHISECKNVSPGWPFFYYRDDVEL